MCKWVFSALSENIVSYEETNMGPKRKKPTMRNGEDVTDKAAPPSQLVHCCHCDSQDVAHSRHRVGTTGRYGLFDHILANDQREKEEGRPASQGQETVDKLYRSPQLRSALITHASWAQPTRQRQDQWRGLLFLQNLLFTYLRVGYHVITTANKNNSIE